MRLSRIMTAPTASRGHVERVATSCAIRMKYSSHDGRARSSAVCSWEVSMSALSKGSIQSIPCVAEPGHYKGLVVELGVHGCGVEVHVGMLPGEPLDARHGGDGVDAGDPGRPLVLELREGRREAPSGREHRVEDEHQVVLQVTWQVHVVLDRLGGLLVPEETHEAYGGFWEQGQGSVEHPEACAQDGDEAHGAGDLLGLRLCERGANARRAGG